MAFKSEGLKDAIRETVAGARTVESLMRHVEWDRMAHSARERFPAPDAVEASDLAQELRLYAFEAVQRADPSRGDPATFVIFHAYARARRWYDKQQGRLRIAPKKDAVRMPRGKNGPCRTAPAFLMSVSAAEAADRYPLEAVSDWSAEERADMASAYRRALDAGDDVGRACVRFYVQTLGNVDKATALVAVAGYKAGRTKTEIRRRVVREVEAAAQRAVAA